MIIYQSTVCFQNRIIGFTVHDYWNLTNNDFSWRTHVAEPCDIGSLTASLFETQ